MATKSKVKLETLLEQLDKLGEEEKKVVREKLKIKDQKKIELDPKDYQTIYQVLQLTIKFLEKNRPMGEEEPKEKDLNFSSEISFGLYNQKKTDSTGEKTKVLQIWWRDKNKLKGIRKVKVLKEED